MTSSAKTLRAQAALRLEEKCLRLINRRLRVLERNFGVQYVAFRLSVQPSLARQFLAGEKRLTLERISDLALAVGCELKLNVRHTKAAALKRKRTWRR